MLNGTFFDGLNNVLLMVPVGGDFFGSESQKGLLSAFPHVYYRIFWGGGGLLLVLFFLFYLLSS